MILIPISKSKEYVMEAVDPMLGSLFTKAAGLKACKFIKKEIPMQVLSCECSITLL